ncbi:MAG: hypothetical protein ACYCYI_07550 [Saccharofermentanales bacterium]
MKWIVKKILSFFNETGNIFAWFLYFLYNHKWTAKLKPIGEKVIIAGNGPSVETFDFEGAAAKGYRFMCVNFFALEEERFFALKPSYYCIIDKAFYSAAYCKDNPKTSKLSEVFGKVDWDMTLVCLPGQKIQMENPHIRLVNINNNPYLGNLDRVKKWLYDSNKGTFGYQNVINAALFYLLSAGAAQIGLTGVENDWHRELFVDIKNDVIRETKHFYGTQFINITQRGDIKKGELFQYFYYYYLTLQKYSLAAKYAKLRKICVINYCVNSFIDTFDKIEFAEQVQGAESAK